jgi:hypothetical protein
MSDKIRTDLSRTEKKKDIIPDPFVMPDGMLQCLKCKQTFSEMDIYEDHYIDAHT